MTAIFWASYAAFWLLLAVQGFALIELIRQVGILRRQVQAQPAARVPGSVDTGARLPAISGVRAVDGQPAAWDDYLWTHHAAAVFITAQCLTCREIAEAFGGLPRERPDVAFVALLEGPRDKAEAFVDATGLPRDLTVFDERGETADRIGIKWKPAVLTIERGRVGAAALANDVYQIDILIQDEFEHAHDERVHGTEKATA